MYLHYRPTRVQSSPGPRSGSSASSSGTTTPRPATATPSVPPPAPSRPAQKPAQQAVQLSDLQNILSTMRGIETGVEGVGVFFVQYGYEKWLKLCLQSDLFGGKNSHKLYINYLNFSDIFKFIGNVSADSIGNCQFQFCLCQIQNNYIFPHCLITLCFLFFFQCPLKMLNSQVNVCIN